MPPITPAGPTGDEQTRVLHRLRIDDGLTGAGAPGGWSVGVIVDVETTGIDVDADSIVELSLRRFGYDADGVVTKVDRSYTWLEDPGRPLPADVARLTGIADADLAGQKLDDARIAQLLGSARFCCAHNAAFDRRMIERRLPAARGMAWACSCRDVDWPAFGFDGRSLGWLLAQCGHFHGAHRAEDDVDAVLALLMHRVSPERTILAEMLGRASAISYRFRAVGASFDVKDALRARGYRWSPDRREWVRDVPAEGREAEEWWLARQVYSADAHPRALAPIVEEVDWFARYS